MTIIMTMLKVNIHEAKANLSKYVAAAGRGETVIICHRNLPVAELRALPRPRKARGLSNRAIGTRRAGGPGGGAAPRPAPRSVRPHADLSGDHGRPDAGHARSAHTAVHRADALVTITRTGLRRRRRAGTGLP